MRISSGGTPLWNRGDLAKPFLVTQSQHDVCVFSERPGVCFTIDTQLPRSSVNPNVMSKRTFGAHSKFAKRTFGFWTKSKKREITWNDGNKQHYGENQCKNVKHFATDVFRTYFAYLRQQYLCTRFHTWITKATNMSFGGTCLYIHVQFHFTLF